MKKKIILTFFTIICTGCILFCSTLCYRNIVAIQTESDLNGGKEKSNEEYIYKEELLHLGYSIQDIETIEKKISNVDVKNYLLTEKYKNLVTFISSPYFNAKNASRYQAYFDRTSYTSDVCVLYVEIGLDKDFYTNVTNTDISKNELMIINKYNNLLENYTPTLVELAPEYGKGQLQVNAASAFVKMADAAKLDNITLFSKSAYRSYNTQNSLYNNYVKKQGQTKSDTFSARAGHSEHQSGYAVDINTTKSEDNFQNTSEYSWLINNSYKYGFILRYPKNKTHITGYIYEPWHFRFVGIDAATKIYQEDITFEEYYVKYQ